MNNTPLLVMENISKSFPGVKALDKVNFTLKGGTTHALMGENGAGKSTLMKCLFGVYEKDSEVRQTIGLPVLSKIPILKYLFSTTTVVRETTYIIITAEASLVTPATSGAASSSRTVEIHERQQKDFFED